MIFLKQFSRSGLSTPSTCIPATSNSKIPILLASFVLLWSLTSCDWLFPPPDEKTEYGNISGLVLNLENDLPILGAVVKALVNQVADTTDSLGAFQLDSLLTGPDTLCVSATYYATGYKALSVTEEPQETMLWLDVGELGCIPVEDTGRVYLRPIYLDTLEIYPKALAARFDTSLTDTNQIKALLDEYNLIAPEGISVDLWGALLCVTGSSRAECHFTPYGKEGFNNFGADSRVEYAFGIFSNGSTIIDGEINFIFRDGTPQERIDSLFQANGLRFTHIMPWPNDRFNYHTLITPLAKKNVLDLGNELQSIPFAERVSVALGTRLYGPFQCD